MLLDRLSKISFSLRRTRFLRLADYIDKCVSLLTNADIVKNDKVMQLLNLLEKNVDELEKCVNTSRDERKCLEIAKVIYCNCFRYYLYATNKIRDLIRTRRMLYLGISLGLPLMPLFGATYIVVAILFLALLWNYMNVVRFKKLGLLSLYIVATAILPFTVAGINYGVYALTSLEELHRISEALNVDPTTALMIALTIFIVSLVSTTTIIYSLAKLYTYRDAFS